jgi:hypothetical protein
MWMTGLRQAALLLEGGPDVTSVGVMYLATDSLPEDERALWGDGQNAYAFRRFVAALERHRSVEELRFDHCRFCRADPTELDDDHDDDDDDDEDDDGETWQPPVEVVRLCGEDVDRLFAAILPNHPSIGTLQFVHCRIHPRHITSLLSGLRSPASDPPVAAASSLAQRRQVPLASLDFISTDLSHGGGGWEAVAAGIGAGARLRRIHIDYGAGLTKETCRLLGSAVASNACVDELVVRQRDAGVVLDADCLGPVLAGPTSIRALTVASDQGGTGQADAAETADWLPLLRTCEVLENLTIAVPLFPDQAETLLEALRTYNFTLQHVGLG